MYITSNKFNLPLKHHDQPAAVVVTVNQDGTSVTVPPTDESQVCKEIISATIWYKIFCDHIKLLNKDRLMKFGINVALSKLINSH